MRKTGLILAMFLGAAVCLSGCGFQEGAGATITVIKATPTPTPSPTPEVTPTPIPTPTPEVVTETTASGIVVTKQDGVYYATDDVNLRADASTEANVVSAVVKGTQLNSTGVCDNGWIQVNLDGTSVYASGDFVSTTAP